MGGVGWGGEGVWISSLYFGKLRIFSSMLKYHFDRLGFVYHCHSYIDADNDDNSNNNNNNYNRNT